MRNISIVIGLVFAAGAWAGTTAAQTAPREPGYQIAQADPDAPRRPRPRVRIYRDYDERGVYPSYNPGPNAVRDCTATYVQEYRPSGTVITPRVNCFWRRG